MLTKFGKRLLTSYIAGIADFGRKDIAIGIANNSDYTLADTNSRLGFEFFRLPVTLGSIDIQSDNAGGYTYVAVYKATIPQDISGTISEVGLYPAERTSLNSYDSKYLSDFENVLDWTNSLGGNPALIDSTVLTPRIGDFTAEFRFDSGDSTNTTREYKTATGSLDISGYSVNDSITLAFNRNNTNSSNIKIKFYSSDTDYFYGNIDLTTLSTGNYIKEISLADVFANMSGSPDATNISFIGIEITRASTGSNAIVYMDGLRINDQDTFDPTYGMVSRSILNQPIIKLSGRPIDIEYRLALEF
jgi:hypothetical protein